MYTVTNERDVYVHHEGRVFFSDQIAVAIMLTDYALDIRIKGEEPYVSSTHKRHFYLGMDCRRIFDDIPDSIEGRTEELLFDEIEEFYQYYLFHNKYGPIIWCSIKRKKLPREIYLESMNRIDIWNPNRETKLKDKNKLAEIKAKFNELVEGGDDV